MGDARETRFGSMWTARLPFKLTEDVEILTFHRHGRPHRHDRMEWALCLSGYGTVWVGEVEYSVEEGDSVLVPSGELHWMDPAAGEKPLVMLVAYEAAP